MYFPFLRGKQNELIALRELSEQENIINFMRPIIEPVKNNIKPIQRTVEELNEKGIEPLIVLTPSVGSCSLSSEQLLAGLTGLQFNPCFILSEREESKTLQAFEAFGEKKALYLACGISRNLQEIGRTAQPLILHNDTPAQALRNLEDFVLVHDGFKKLSRNADYPHQSPFSELHISFKDQPGCLGFSDYSITGRDFSESGGPAYVVTIHLSFIDHESYDEMFIRHLSSKSNANSPSDPAEKFSEALTELITFVDNNPGIIRETDAVREFRSLHKRQHFPGLGQVKKLSIMHHIQTICDYLAEHQ